MYEAKDILFMLLSCQTYLVRRASGLGWLASLWFSNEEKEQASLSSDTLYATDQVLKGNSLDGRDQAQLIFFVFQIRTRFHSSDYNTMLRNPTRRRNLFLVAFLSGVL